MKYLKKITAGEKFRAYFVNGQATDSYDVASFFMMMGDKEAKPEDLPGYIKLGRMLDFAKPWDEIEEIAKTFIAKDAA